MKKIVSKVIPVVIAALCLMPQLAQSENNLHKLESLIHYCGSSLCALFVVVAGFLAIAVLVLLIRKQHIKARAFIQSALLVGLISFCTQALFTWMEKEVQEAETTSCWF